MTNSSQLTLITNANLYTPKFVGNRNVLVAGGKIVAISEQAIELPESLNVSLVDLAGKRLVPGFVDSHAHITGGGGEAGFSTQVPPVNISEFTHAGVTTVIGLLGTDDTTRTTGNVLAKVNGLREEGMSAYCWTGGYHYPLTTLTGSAKTDIVYLDSVIGIGEFAISDHRSSQPTFDEVIKLASEAHVAGLITGKAGVIHFHLGDGDRKLQLIERAISETEIPARVFNPTHVNRNKPLYEDSLQLLKLGCNIDITAFPKDCSEPGYSAAEAIKIAVDRKVSLEQITVSSDGGGCMPFFDCQGNLTKMDFGRAITLLEALQESVELGIDFEQVLPMLTSNVAEYLRLNNKGRIVEGNDADFVVLDKDLNITDVMAMGHWHLKDGQSVIKGTFE
ncbi:beta-aspartyl-peptidase [Thalassotalea crassostreae]|uniref:beta-aspartyl-peptidase n=1 Tax=Thalassotalea crassostreae TaxID=1763536 RepID=UPI000838C5CF|nr:beta-aspartyl-peptidase [Thalassotalea crassostreae]